VSSFPLHCHHEALFEISKPRITGAIRKFENWQSILWHEEMLRWSVLIGKPISVTGIIILRHLCAKLLMYRETEGMKSFQRLAFPFWLIHAFERR
jgi:hypothetical protein